MERGWLTADKLLDVSSGVDLAFLAELNDALDLCDENRLRLEEERVK